MTSPLTDTPTNTMDTAMNETSPALDIAVRGYDRRQVDAHLSELVAQCRAVQQRAAGLEEQIKRLPDERRAADREQSQPSYAGLGAQVETILRLAEDEARDLRAEAKLAAERERSLADDEAAQVRTRAEEAAQRRAAEGDQAAASLVEQARTQAVQIRSDADDEAAAKRTEAANIIEQAQARAAEVAAEVEAKLAHRRAHAERDLAARLEAADRRLVESGEKAEQLRLEAQKLRDEAERRARQLLEAAYTEAEDLVANSRANLERQRMESERELAALTHRRDSVNAQLSNVREMLLTLTGPDMHVGQGGGDQSADNTRRNG